MLGELLLSSYLAFSSPTIPDSSNINSRINTEIISRPTVYSKHLKVNTENTVKYISFKSEDLGINDMRVMVDTSEFEESLLFDIKNNHWLETGLSATGWVNPTVATGMSPNVLEIDFDLTIKMIDSLDALYMFHFHPIKNSPDIINKSSFPGLEGVVDTYNKVYAYIASVLPSDLDLGVMLFDESLFYAKHPDGIIKHKIVSYLGVTEFYLNENAIDMINDGYMFLYSPSRDVGLLAESLKPNINSFFAEDFDTIESYCIDKIYRALEYRNNDYIEIKFTPFEDYKK